MIKIRTLFLVFFLTHGWSNAQFNYSVKAEKLHNDIFRLKVNSAQLNTSSLKETNGILNWLNAYNDFLQYHFGNSTLNAQMLNENLIAYISKIKHLQNNSPYYYFCLTELYLLKAYTEFTDENYYSASKSFIKAYRYIDKNKTKYPNFDLNYRHELVQLSIDYWLVKNIPFLFKKVKKAGAYEIRELVSSSKRTKHLNKVFESELNLLSVFICSHILDDKKLTIKTMSSFPDEWKNGGPLQVLAYNKFMPDSANMSKKELLQSSILKGYNNSCNKLNLCYGEILLNELNDSCETYLQKFKQNQSNKHDILYVNLKLSWHYYMQNNFDSVNSLIKDSQLLKAITNNDKQALYEFKNKNNWDTEIIKARVLFDGGNHKAALEVLLKKQKTIEKHNGGRNTEVNYRLARIYHDLQQYDKALKLYGLVVNSKTEKQFYYSAYAAYYSGHIYETINNCKLAIESYKKCLNLDSPIYQESIHRKALHRIGNCD